MFFSNFGPSSYPIGLTDWAYDSAIKPNAGSKFGGFEKRFKPKI